MLGDEVQGFPVHAKALRRQGASTDMLSDVVQGSPVHAKVLRRQGASTDMLGEAGDAEATRKSRIVEGLADAATAAANVNPIAAAALLKAAVAVAESMPTLEDTTHVMI